MSSAGHLTTSTLHQLFQVRVLLVVSRAKISGLDTSMYNQSNGSCQNRRAVTRSCELVTRTCAIHQTRLSKQPLTCARARVVAFVVWTRVL